MNNTKFRIIIKRRKESWVDRDRERAEREIIDEIVECTNIDEAKSQANTMVSHDMGLIRILEPEEGTQDKPDTATRWDIARDAQGKPVQANRTLRYTCRLPECYTYRIQVIGPGRPV